MVSSKLSLFDCMHPPIRVTLSLHRAPLFYCIDKHSEIACWDFPRHDDPAVGQCPHCLQTRTFVSALSMCQKRTLPPCYADRQLRQRWSTATCFCIWRTPLFEGLVQVERALERLIDRHGMATTVILRSNSHSLAIRMGCSC